MTDDRKQLELDALLEVSMAINANMPEESLYKILFFTCISNLNVQKMAIYVHDGDWDCKITHGTNIDFTEKDLSKKLRQVDATTFIDSFAKLDGFEEFDVVVPVQHKKKILALIFVAGLDKFVVERNPVITFIQTISNIVMVAIENKRLAREKLKQEAMDKELEIARIVQHRLFPKKLPNNEVLSVYTTYFPHQSVGGDYYDLIELNENETLLCMADVSGKGIPAAMMMSNFQASLRTLSRKTSDLEEIAHDLNFQIMSNTEGENFITCFCGVFNKETRMFRYINAGHNSPLLCMDGKIEELKSGTTILGALDKLPFINQGNIEIPKGALMLLYTDGLTETESPEGDEFGEERLEAFIRPRMSLPVEVLHIQLIDEIDGFRQHMDYRDDLTLMSCRFY